MLDLTLIDNTINELEMSDTNFMNCERLASLYIIKSHFDNYTNVPQDMPQDITKADKDEISLEISTNTETSVQKELFDILPHYNMYCDKKRDYQLGKVGKDIVIQSMHLVCNEISEFLHTLYSSTDMQEERDLIMQMLDNLHF